MRSIRTGLAATLAAAVAVACGGAGSAAPASTATTAGGTAATDFTARDIEGKTVRLSDYLGKQVILLDFCATWCTPCLAEIAHIEKLYEQNKARGFVVLAVSMDTPDSVAEVPSWARRNGMTFPVLLDEDSHIASIYNPKKSAPLTVLIDRRGQIVYVHDGYNPGDEEDLRAQVAKALDQGAGPK